MKKVYTLLLIAAGTILSAAAQPFQKGDKLLGGSIGFVSSKNTNSSPETKNNGFGVSLGIGFFTTPKRLTGFTVNYGYGKFVSNGESKYHDIGASIYQQYWSSLAKNFYFVVEGRLTGTYENNKTTFTGSTYSEIKGFQGLFQINPSVAYRINRHLVVDASFSNFLNLLYAHSTVTRNPLNQPSTDYKVDDFVISTGLSNFSTDNIRFGLRYIL